MQNLVCLSCWSGKQLGAILYNCNGQEWYSHGNDGLQTHTASTISRTDALQLPIRQPTDAVEAQDINNISLGNTATLALGIGLFAKPYSTTCSV